MIESQAPTDVLRVEDLTVELTSGMPVVSDVTFSIARGQTLGLVGESGSGKSTTALALLGYARSGMRIAGGRVEIDGQAMELQHERAARPLRGVLISHVPQDPATSLNPAIRIGSGMADIAARVPAGSTDELIASTLERVGLPSSRQFKRRFPHQLSGGQQQRVLIADALLSEPPLIVLDEPTTGLDVVTQAQVLAEIKRLHDDRGIAMVYVTHDLAVVAQIADRVAVMYAGRVVESGPVDTIFSDPKHPYTRGLIAAIPDHVTPRKIQGIPGLAAGVTDRPSGCPFGPRCAQRVPRCETEMPQLEVAGPAREVRCFESDRTPPLQLEERLPPRTRSGAPELLRVEGLRAEHRSGRDSVVAAEDVSFAVSRGECLALVGESGSGKTTIARAIAGLHPPTRGRMLLDGTELAARAKDRPRDMRRRCQIIFQNPYESLNPRRSILDEVSRPAKLLRGLSTNDSAAEARRLLELVRLPVRSVSKFPGELSGGERQRVAIARALAAAPELLICDEVTSALDVSVQAAVIELLDELRSELDLALLFITHDLAVVACLADRVIILDHGAICEEGLVSSVFEAPASHRGKELLNAVLGHRPTTTPSPQTSDAATGG